MDEKDLKPWEKIISTQEEFDKVQRDMIMSRISADVLKSLPWYSVELICTNKADYSNQLTFYWKKSHRVIVPAHRSYWQKGQKKSHMGISSGYGVFLECKYRETETIDGKLIEKEKTGKFFLATLREGDAGNHHWQINLFNGFPKYNPNNDDLYAEHKNLKSTASRKIVERLVILAPDGYRLLPRAIFNETKFNDSDLQSFLPKSNKNSLSILERNNSSLISKLDKIKMQNPLKVDGMIMSTNNTKCINILHWDSSTEENKDLFIRSGVVVFDKSQDTTEDTMNFDVINACNMQLPDYFIEDLTLIYGDEEESSGRYYDWMMVAILCDDNFEINPNAFQIAYFWKSGKRLGYTEAVSISPEHKKAINHPVLTPVTKALLDAKPRVNREKKNLTDDRIAH